LIDVKYIEENIAPFVFSNESNLVQNVTSYFGTIIGRVANRIAGAPFTLNGTLYKLVPSEGKNKQIHGTNYVSFYLCFLFHYYLHYKNFLFVSDIIKTS